MPLFSINPHGKIAPEVGAMYSQVYEQVRPYSINAPPSQVMAALREWPIAGWCQAVHTNLILNTFVWPEDGTTLNVYEHEDERIKEFVNQNLSQLGCLPSRHLKIDENGRVQQGDPKQGRIINGSFPAMISKASLSFALNHLLFERADTLINGQWMIESLLPIPIGQQDEFKTGYQTRNYYDIDVRGSRFQGIWYRDRTRADRYIPASALLYFSGKPELNPDNDPRGFGIGEAILPAFDAFKIVIAAMLNCAQSQAGKRLHGQASGDQTALLAADGRPVIGEDGRPKMTSGMQNLTEQLSRIESGEAIVTDLASKIIALDTETKGELIATSWELTESLVMQAYNFTKSYLMAAEQGTGLTGGLPEIHQQNVLSTIRSASVRIKNEVIWMGIRPSIIFNFGEQENYGHFPNPEQWDLTDLKQFEALSNHFGRAGADESASLRGDEFYSFMMQKAGVPAVLSEEMAAAGRILERRDESMDASTNGLARELLQSLRR